MPKQAFKMTAGIGTMKCGSVKLPQRRHDRRAFWKTHADTDLNARQKLMLNKLLTGFEGKRTSSKWAKMTKSSQPTAGREIDQLLTLGILRKEAASGRSTSYLLVLE